MQILCLTSANSSLRLEQQTYCTGSGQFMVSELLAYNSHLIRFVLSLFVLVKQSRFPNVQSEVHRYKTYTRTQSDMQITLV